jgi:hypothetical protein
VLINFQANAGHSGKEWVVKLSELVSSTHFSSVCMMKNVFVSKEKTIIELITRRTTREMHTFFLYTWAGEEEDEKIGLKNS